MKHTRALSWIVLGIGIALIILGVAMFAQQFVPRNTIAAIALPPALDAVDAVGAADTLSAAGEAPVDQAAPQTDQAEQAQTQPSGEVKLASADAAIAVVPQTQANPLPTVDVASAVTQYQAAFPIPDHLWIDKIKVNATIQPVGPGKSAGQGTVEWTSPKNKSVGWHDYSGRMGEGKNIVLNGHNNIHGAVFRKLYTLKAGDEIRLGAGDQVMRYVVEEAMILKERGQPLEVRIDNAKYIQPMADDRLTIVSCWPENNNTHRVIVIARPVKT